MKGAHYKPHLEFKASFLPLAKTLFYIIGLCIIKLPIGYIAFSFIHLLGNVYKVNMPGYYIFWDRE
jgi:hypothetical protein